MRQVILIPDETGDYTVEVPSLPGCISEGDTLEEALANINEAIDLYIESLIENGEDVPSGEVNLLGYLEIDFPAARNFIELSVDANNMEMI